jgi:CDP-diacylglycerol--serine O-phosphatidyltransferase
LPAACVTSLDGGVEGPLLTCPCPSSASFFLAYTSLSLYLYIFDTIFEAWCLLGACLTVKRIPLLPTLLTLGNGVCGFAAIAYASKITLDGSMTAAEIDYYFLLSAGLILVAMVFDVLDGYAARLARCTSEFGGQLDSLCDAISFGAAPAFLLLRLGQEWQANPLVAKLVAVVAALYLACAVMRLARFNCENSPDSTSHKRFKGLPSPAAGGCVASLAVLRSDLAASVLGLESPVLHTFVSIWAPIGTFVVALLMVSRFSYPHFGRQLLRGRHHFRLIVQVVVVAAVIALMPNLAFFLLFWAYALLAPLRHVLVQMRRRAVAEHTPGLH